MNDTQLHGDITWDIIQPAPSIDEFFAHYNSVIIYGSEVMRLPERERGGKKEELAVQRALHALRDYSILIRENPGYLQLHMASAEDRNAIIWYLRKVTGLRGERSASRTYSISDIVKLAPDIDLLPEVERPGESTLDRLMYGTGRKQMPQGNGHSTNFWDRILGEGRKPNTEQY